MRLLLLAWSLFAAPAFADDEIVYAKGTVQSDRFPDADVDGPEFNDGTRLTVLVREGERLRVQAGMRFGWIKAADTTKTAPGGDPGGAPPSIPITIP
jgi:hypothetical protein